MKPSELPDCVGMGISHTHSVTCSVLSQFFVSLFFILVPYIGTHSRNIPISLIICDAINYSTEWLHALLASSLPSAFYYNTKCHKQGPKGIVEIRIPFILKFACKTLCFNFTSQKLLFYELTLLLEKVFDYCSCFRSLPLYF